MRTENSTGTGRGPRPGSQESDVDMPSVVQNYHAQVGAPRATHIFYPTFIKSLGHSLRKLTNFD